MALKPLKTLNFGGEDTYYLDFKNVENTPFETVGSDTLTWDGETEGKTCVSLGNGVYLIHVSDATPALDDFKKGFSGLIYSNGEIIEAPLSEEELIEMQGVFLYTGAFFAVVTEENASVEGIILPAKGTYLYYVDPEFGDYYVSSLTINGYTGFPSTKLKEECVPIDYITEKVLSALPTWSGGEY